MHETTPDRRNLGQDIVAGWCDDAGVADDVAALFLAHAAPPYISHSELQTGRATAIGTWAADLGNQILQMAVRAAATPRDAGGLRLATLSRDGRLLGFALVTFARDAAVPYATLEDLLIVPEERGRGGGQSFVNWIAAECQSAGMRRLFLESGGGNLRAHDFFAREGFREISIVMMRDL